MTCGGGGTLQHVRVPVDRVVAGVVAVAVTFLGGVVLHAQDSAARAPRATVQVIDEQWQPVTGATISPVGRGDGVVTDRSGQARIRTSSPILVRVSADGHLGRTLAVAPGSTARAVLTRRTAGTLSLRFGGDVMAGRRFYDRNEDGDRRDGLLPQDATVADHERLLRPVRPLLGDSDLTVVNLETPLRSHPWFDPTGARPRSWHPTKDFVFASSPRVVPALMQAGVDVVSLGNNHVFDGLDHGLRSTLRSLDLAGLPHFGAGRTPAEAWRPAFLQRAGQRVAFLGCTTITGSEHVIDYVAAPDKGGAARCTKDRLQRAVTAARRRADLVVVMIHGGDEYQAAPTSVVAALSATASAAGARIVVDGHPHVVGGVRMDRGALIADTMGNLLFDQTVWPTFLSYLLRADVRRGRVVSATTDPLLIRGYLPRPVVGQVADSSSRRAVGLGAVAGPTGSLLGPGADVTRVPDVANRRLHLVGHTPRRLPSGWWLSQPPPGVRVGEDLLWTGGFEDEDTDPATDGGAGWSWSPNGGLDRGAACRGSSGIVLRRGPLSRQDAVLTPQHRQLVSAGMRLTLQAKVKRATRGGTIELRLYQDTMGASSDDVRARIAPHRSGNRCAQVRLDVTVPAGVVAVQPFLRLAPPRSSQTESTLAVDDVRLTAWSPTPAAGPRWDMVESATPTTLRLVGLRP